MPSALTLGGLLVALTLQADALPQDPLYLATVKVPEALVRSGPSENPQVYPTNQLRQGTVVEVMQECEGGWLAIKPPAGSSDWINTRFLQRHDPYVWIVTTHDDAPAPVLMASSMIQVQDKPTKIAKKLVRGSFVVSLGRVMDDAKDNDGRWMLIEPPDGEVRYIKAEQVARVPDPGATTAAGTPAPPAPPTPGAAVPQAPPAPTNVAGNFRIPAPGAAGTSPLPPAAVGSTDPRWQQAQQYEQQGRPADAAQLYTELAQAMSSQNHDFAMQCYNRAYFLRESARNAAAPPAPPPDARYSATAGSRLTPVPAAGAGQQIGYQTQAPPQTQQSNYAAVPDPTANLPVRQSPPGQLRPAGQSIDGKRTYVLISPSGELLAYVTAEPGVDLEPYLNRNIQVTGPLGYHMGVRGHYVRAQQVTPLP
jgi:SH3-like domain-containing protein